MPADAVIDPPSALPRGARLGEFELRGVLGAGGFGIVYLAFDHTLEREVAVKEYMPASLAERSSTLDVTVRSQSDAETFEIGLRSFVNEARLLARFDHPSLVKVHRFWRAHGTAYLAMPVYRGRTLKALRVSLYESLNESLQEPPDEALARSVLLPLLGALERLHAEGVYHRDIAPDNIIIDADGHPVLLDFGAARRVIGDRTQSLTAILKPAYAPIEQYAEAPGVRQGPWTDFYALGATLHYLMLGYPPAPSTTRTVHDDQAALAGRALPGCSTAFLQTLDWMLAPRPGDRPQSVAELREVLAGRRMPPVRSTPLPPPSEAAAPGGTPWPATRVEVADRTAVVAPPIGARTDPSLFTAVRPAAAAPGSTAAPRRGRLMLAGAVVLLAAGAAWMLRPATPLPSAPPAVAAAASDAALPGLPAAQADPPSAASSAAAVPLGADAASVPAPAAGGEAVAAEPPRVAAPAPAQTVAAPPRARPQVSETQRANEPLAIRPPPLMPPAPVRDAASSPAETPALPRVAPAASPFSAERAPSFEQPVSPTARSDAAQPPRSAVPGAATPAPGPAARCADRQLLLNVLCMERQCLRAEYRQHPDCAQWRSGADPRREAPP